jgi:hypothetical protein
VIKSFADKETERLIGGVNPRRSQHQEPIASASSRRGYITKDSGKIPD